MTYTRSAVALDAELAQPHHNETNSNMTLQGRVDGFKMKNTHHMCSYISRGLAFPRWRPTSTSHLTENDKQFIEGLEMPEVNGHPSLMLYDVLHSPERISVLLDEASR